MTFAFAPFPFSFLLPFGYIFHVWTSQQHGIGGASSWRNGEYIYQTTHLHPFAFLPRTGERNSQVTLPISCVWAFPVAMLSVLESASSMKSQMVLILLHAGHLVLGFEGLPSRPEIAFRASDYNLRDRQAGGVIEVFTSF